MKIQTDTQRLYAFLRSCFHWDKPFVRWVAMVAIPMVVQELVGASLHIIDSLMVSGLGDTAYAAVTQANRFTFLFQLFTFGTVSGGSIFMSQYWGAGDVRGMRKVMGLTLLTSGGLAVLFTLPALLTPHIPVSFFLPEGESRAIAITYLRTVAPSYLILAVNMVYAACIKAGEKTYIPLIAGVVSIATNTVLNYAVIYGHFGFAPMGVYGAAVATNIAAGVQLLITLLFAYGKKLPAGAPLRQMFVQDAALLRQFVKTAMPVVFNEGLWALGVTMYGVYYGSMSDVAVAATGICNNIDSLVWVFIFSMMHATAIIIGKTLGAGKKEEAYLYGKRLIAGAMLAGVVLGGIMILLRAPILSLYGGLSPEVIQKANVILLFGSLTMWFRAFNCINVVGILRSGGDTVFSLKLDVGSMWLVGVPLCGIATYLLHWPVEYVYLLSFSEEIVKMAIGIPHFAGRSWIRNLTVKEGETILETH